MPNALLASERMAEFVPRVVSWRMTDWTGVRSGRLSGIRPLRRLDRPGVFWECRCDCGTVTIVNSERLGTTQSCGCWRAENVSRAKRITGLAGTPTYKAWCGMRQRCFNPTHRLYPSYGGRGITVDARWLRFENFLADMGVRPDGLSIDRIDNNAGYCKENCRWATALQQENNKRNNVIVHYRGTRFTVAELARSLGLKHTQIYQRIRRGWSVERAVAVATGQVS